jgi:thiamine biosynthesis lipoprotein
MPLGASRKSAGAHLVEWRGTSLGAVAKIRIDHVDQAAAQSLLRQVVSESRRLETVFSLYLPDSSLCELNRHGVLLAPPAELSEILTLCDHFWRVTHGTFDPTVQPLWRCYADYFAMNDGTSEGPSATKKREALELVGWERVHFDRDKVVFDRRGMGLTLNGIAQGYITDRVVELLRVAGIESCLVDMGEIRGLGAHPDGRPWEVALEAPSGAFDGERSIAIINKAVATSSAVGFRFDEQGRFNHLFDPSTGACAYPARNLTVVAATAVAADALSTAFALMDEKGIKSVLSRWGDAQSYITTESGTRAITAASG